MENKNIDNEVQGTGFHTRNQQQSFAHKWEQMVWQ